MIKCEMYSISLELTVGMVLATDSQLKLKESVASLSHGHMALLHQSIYGISKRLDEGHEETKEVLRQFGITTDEAGEEKKVK